MSKFIERDRRHVWHPFTQQQTECDPIVITRGKGACLYDENGQEFLDLIASWWTCTHGHAHPDLNAALAEQAQTLEHVMFAGFTHPTAVDLAAKLSGLLAEDLNRVFFSDDGSTAVEVALKVAFQYWRNQGDVDRQIFLAMDGGYHGDTFGAMAVGRGSGFFTLYEDLMCEVRTIPFAETWEGDTGVETREQQALDVLDKEIEAHGNQIAAIILEPLLQGAGGMRMCRPQFIDALVNRASRAGILTIFDEIATGFGRTGKLFAYQNTNVVPDIICLSKGLTAGYLPMSVTIVRDRIYEKFLADEFDKALAHGHSFTANPLACAVALRSLELFDTEGTLEKIDHMRQRHIRVAEDLKQIKAIKNVRVLGTVLVADLMDQSGYKSAASLFLRDGYLARGFNIRPIGDAVYLMPPYCITDGQLDRAYHGLIEGLQAMEEKFYRSS